MSSCTLLFRFALVATILLVSIPGVFGWALQNWSTTPAESGLPMGTPVKVTYSIHFDSWATGSTFEKDNTLIMYTDLSGPQWVVKKTKTLEDQSPLLNSSWTACQHRSGWTDGR